MAMSHLSRSPVFTAALMAGCIRVKSSQVLLLHLTREPYLWDCLLRIPCIITHRKSLIVQMPGNSEEDPGQRGFS